MGIFKRKKKAKENFDDFPPIGGLMVSKQVSEQGKKPMFMYREKRSRPEDSGWRIFSGYESPEFTNDPNNTGIYNPSTILKLDPSIKDLLLKGVGSVYERGDAESEWYKVTDYDLEDDYMVHHKLGKSWALHINNLFQRIPEETGDLLYTTGDKSLRISIWNDPGKTSQEILEEHIPQVKDRDQSISKTLDDFEFSDETVKRIGYEIEEQDGNKRYNVIYAFSFIDGEILQMAFYFDDQNDKEWALDTWKNISKHEKQND